MADTTTVCSMCGDVGFPERLFQCMRCLSRFQHSYCSNYYEEDPSKTAGVCDWCLSEERSTTVARHSKKPAGKDAGSGIRSEHSSGDKVKQDSEREESGSRGKSTTTVSSSKATGRRYKLLKDVLC